MKKVILMLGILLFGMMLMFYTFRISLLDTEDHARFKSLEQNAEVSLNNNIDSSSRVMESGDVLMNVYSFEEDVIYSFLNNANVKVRAKDNVFDMQFEFEYLLIQNGTEKIMKTKVDKIAMMTDAQGNPSGGLDINYVRDAGLKDSESLKGTRVTATISGKTYTVRHAVDIKD